MRAANLRALAPAITLLPLSNIPCQSGFSGLQSNVFSRVTVSSIASLSASSVPQCISNSTSASTR